MAEQKKCMQYCGMTISDYSNLKKITCPCLKCFGKECDECEILKKSETSPLDFLREMCRGCGFYNGR